MPPHEAVFQIIWMKNTLLSEIANRLSAISDTSTLDASVLLGHIANKPRTWVVAHPELTLTGAQYQQLEDSLTRLELGEPFPYVLGHWEFFGLDLNVTPEVLIPRPETELLVENAITWLNQHPDRRSVADVGTGSGAIAISLAFNIPDVKILATDISPKALQVAMRNAEMHGVLDRIEFVECDLLSANQTSEIDLLCANLPYIPTKTLQGLPVLGHEPTLALDGGVNGFELVQRLMQIAPDHLAPESVLLFEIEETLGSQAVELSHQYFPNANIKLRKDLTGRDRLLKIEVK